MSGYIDERRYPHRYNRNIEDGSRHKDAVGHALLHPEHDIFSSLWICQKYHVQQSKMNLPSAGAILAMLEKLNPMEELPAFESSSSSCQEDRGFPQEKCHNTNVMDS
jgi:hypothetical protein